jgi:uncharacterized Zn finger protein (UPF0148 family)
VILERESHQSSVVRVTWEKEDHDVGSLLAPLQAGQDPILPEGIFNLSDLLFHLAGVHPIKVRKSKRDPDSTLVRLSFRDLMWYCYLKQDDLDSSFFRMEDPFKRNKSIDAMRFVVGFHSDRLNELEGELVATQDRLRSNRLAAAQIREFLRKFQLGTDIGIDEQMREVDGELSLATQNRNTIEANHAANTHVVEPLRRELRALANQLAKEEESLADLEERVGSQRALRAEFVSAKIKSNRSEVARSVLAGVQFRQCPACGSPIAPDRGDDETKCSLCGQRPGLPAKEEAIDVELLRNDLNTRIDELDDLIARHEKEIEAQKARVERVQEEKRRLDRQLTLQLEQYDSAYVSQIRAIERKIAELEERQRFLGRLAEMPRALEQMEGDAGTIEGRIANLRGALEEERARLSTAASLVEQLQNTFLSIMLEIGFPGISATDHVEISIRNWKPRVYHGEDDEHGWDFTEAGSGGKKVLFNVCYALAVHKVAAENNLPLPTLLIVDGPTKNISSDVNPALVASYFRLIYSLAAGPLRATQYLLIDSDLVEPQDRSISFTSLLLTSDDPQHPPLISYYGGP